MPKVFSTLYSPFASSRAFSPRQRSLLLQFIFVDLKHSAVKDLVEHISLLPIAFPEVPSDGLRKILKKLEQFDTISSSQQKAICIWITPFIHACREDEGLILFLLRNHQAFKKNMNLSVLLRSWYAESWEEFIANIVDKWQARGFTSLSQEVVELIQAL